MGRNPSGPRERVPISYKSLEKTKRQFLPTPPLFSSCTPHSYAKTKLPLLIFKIPKLPLT